MELNKITREVFFNLNENQVVLITHPGRMGDEDGTTFIIKMDDGYKPYRIGGWFMGNIHNDKDYITYNEVMDHFSKVKECIHNIDNNNYSDKYVYYNMGFGNGLLIDKSIYDEYYPLLEEEAKKDKNYKETKNNYNISFINVWDKAFIKMTKK